MLYLFLSIVALIGGIVLKRKFKDDPRDYLKKSNYAAFGLSFVFFVLVHTVYIDSDKTGHLIKHIGSKSLPQGSIIAVEGEKGPQAEILQPGLAFKLFLRIFYKVEKLDVIVVPEGHFGFLVAKDGHPMDDGAFMARQWADGKEGDMLKATHFLTEGNGQKGPQLNVLKPAIYRINRYLFDVSIRKALDVPTGNVAVIRSNVQTAEDCPSAIDHAGGTPNDELSAPIVRKGCVGVWDEAYPPGRYYLNDVAYVSTIIPTRVQVWTYSGGYTTRQIDLKVESDGSINQVEKEIKVEIPKDAADKAINVRVEGWKVPVEGRIVVQVSPQLAPRVVASTGSLQNVENNIITPAFRDILRTIGGREGRKVLDFVSKRDEIVTECEETLVPEGLKAGVNIQEVRLGEPALPPEVLIPDLRKQLATSLKNTFQEEKAAQKERIEVEKTKAEADQQSKLMEAKIAKEAAEHTKLQQKLLGEGERLRLSEIAKGQKEQSSVLGKEATAQLKGLEMMLAAAKENPDIIKVPQVQVLNNGEGSSLEGAAAVLRGTAFLGMGSNIAQSAKLGPEGKQ